MKMWFRDTMDQPSVYEEREGNRRGLFDKEVRQDNPFLDFLDEEDIEIFVKEFNKKAEVEYKNKIKNDFIRSSELFTKYTGKEPKIPEWIEEKCEVKILTCCKCGTTKEPVVEPVFALGEHYIIGYRAICLGVNEGLDCNKASPLFVDEEDAAKYGVAYLKGVYVE